jgi:nucleoside phosphorylase
VSSDEETAEVAKAARAAGVPFIGFRGVSDGGGDPLHLPGFPFQFFVYRQLSADNVAAVAVSFIQAWNDTSNLGS